VTYQLHHGDMLDILPMMERESIDALVCDPPYGLGFMGKDWDHGVPGEHFWREAYRVAKPGAYLLAFGGTRTFHRLAVAIEDAGWELRDTVMWVYGQGFPKSHDVSKAIDKEAGAEREVIGQRKSPYTPTGRNTNTYGEYETPTNESGYLQYAITAPATPLAAQWQGWGTALKPAYEIVILAQKPLTDYQYCAIMIQNLSERIESWAQDINSKAATSGSMSEAESIALNTLLSWRSILADCFDQGRTSTTSTESEMITDWKTLNFCLLQIMQENITPEKFHQSGRSVPASNAEKYFSATLAKLNATRDLSVLENAIKQDQANYRDETVKPNFTPIIVARKPLQGTVAENVTRYGTGAMNIDQCRIETEPRNPGYANRLARTNNVFGEDKRTRPLRDEYDTSQGRWPANLIHDGSAEVLAGFPQSNVPGPYRQKTQARSEIGMSVDVNGMITPHYGDTGSAARFFYCAKASKQDRDEGCEGLEERTTSRMNTNNGSEDDGEAWHPIDERTGKERDRFVAQVRNHHPTVKPTSLMRYLCRLVTPPNGTILDPFMGSSSTGKAAILEGFNFVGVELEQEYIEIAARRIEHACGKVGIVVEQPMLFDTKRETVDATKQLMLL
jgi:DNA modification methylase